MGRTNRLGVQFVLSIPYPPPLPLSAPLRLCVNPFAPLASLRETSGGIGQDQQDELDFWNLRTSPKTSCKSWLGKHASIPFNPDVANVFFRAGMIEAWGRGIERIMEACREAATPEPEVKCEPSGLWVAFRFLPEHQVPREVAAKTSVRILELLQRNPEMTLAQVASEIGRSVRAVELASSKLVKAGRLRYVGPQKGGHWEVLK